MTYKTISNLYSRNSKLPYSMNDPNNSYSYISTTIENFVPISYQGGTKASKTNNIIQQQAIQQQIIYLHKQNELQQEKQKALDNLRKLNILRQLKIANKSENNVQDTAKNLENQLNVLNQLVSQDKNGGY